MKKYWPIILVILIFITVILVSIFYSGDGILIDIKYGSKKLFSADTRKILEILIPLFIVLVPLMAGLLNLYKFNLVSINLETSFKDLRSLQIRYNSLESSTKSLISAISNSDDIDKLKNDRYYTELSENFGQQLKLYTKEELKTKKDEFTVF